MTNKLSKEVIAKGLAGICRDAADRGNSPTKRSNELDAVFRFLQYADLTNNGDYRDALHAALDSTRDYKPGSRENVFDAAFGGAVAASKFENM